MGWQRPAGFGVSWNPLGPGLDPQPGGLLCTTSAKGIVFRKEENKKRTKELPAQISHVRSSEL